VSEGAQAEGFVSGKTESAHKAPAEAGEQLVDFRDAAVVLGWDGLLHAHKTSAPVPSPLDAVRWAHIFKVVPHGESRPMFDKVLR
jgi:hypothetical protein